MTNPKKITLAFLLIITSLLANAQQKTLAKFVITSASENGEDITPMLLEQGAFCVFYTFEGDSVMYLSNQWPKNATQSFGPLFPKEECVTSESLLSRNSGVSNYSWYFMNDYNNEKGTAQVQLTKFQKVIGVTFIIEIITPKKDVLEYKGYLEGSIDFTK